MVARDVVLGMQTRGAAPCKVPFEEDPWRGDTKRGLRHDVNNHHAATTSVEQLRLACPPKQARYRPLKTLAISHRDRGTAGRRSRRDLSRSKHTQAIGRSVRTPGCAPGTARRGRAGLPIVQRQNPDILPSSRIDLGKGQPPRVWRPGTWQLLVLARDEQLWGSGTVVRGAQDAPALDPSAMPGRLPARGERRRRDACAAQDPSGDTAAGARAQTTASPRASPANQALV